MCCISSKINHKNNEFLGDMERIKFVILLCTGTMILLMGCQTEEAVEDELPDVKAFTNLTLYDGTDAEPIDGVIVIEEGEVLSAGEAGVVQPPERADIYDLEGAFVMPGFINSHGHVGVTDGLNYGSEYYTRENILDVLNTYASYGVTTIVSLGDLGFEGTDIRDEQYNDDLTRSRLYVSGPVIDADSPEDAVEQVNEAAENEVDWIKIRIDDQLGQGEKMPPEVYEAVIETADEHGLEVAAHIVEREDAVDVIEAGATVIAHSVRDRAADYTLVRAMQENDICYIPTLTRELSTFVYQDRPDFFDDPFFQRGVSSDVIAELESDESQQQYRESEAAEYFEEQLPLAKENLESIHESAVDIAMGTDSGMPARFPGFFEHKEMEMMQEAGLDPMDILHSATGMAAECMGLENTGVLETGSKADFIAFEDDPTEDITNTRSLMGVWIAGNEIAID